MSVRPRDLLGAIVMVGLAALTGLATWYFTRPPAKPAAVASTPPATVSGSPKEADLIVVTLIPEAEKRLGLRLALVKEEPVPRVRGYGGEVLIPPGHTISMPAPLSGTLKAPPGAPLKPGQAVTKGQPVFQLTPLLTPDARANLTAALVEADGQVKSAETQRAAAAIALKRAKQLFSQEAGSKRAVDEAQAQHDLAQKALDAAAARKAALAQVAGDKESGTVAPLTLAAPVGGVLRNVLATPGEAVPAGAVLFEVVDLDTVWVRVPIYVGDVAEIVPQASASVGSLAARPGAKPWRAVHVKEAPPSANALAATVDLYYALDNRTARLAPGERVSVILPLRGAEQNLVVPWSAVIHDIHGGTWVYEQIAPGKYVRRRVQVRHVVGEKAVLAEGPKPKTPVVAEGATELFGTEMGFAK